MEKVEICKRCKRIIGNEYSRGVTLAGTCPHCFHDEFEYAVVDVSTYLEEVDHTDKRVWMKFFCKDSELVQHKDNYLIFSESTERHSDPILLESTNNGLTWNRVDSAKRLVIAK